MNLFLPKELVDYINDFIRPVPTLRTIANWRKGSIKFDINELKCAYRMSYSLDMYVRRKYHCDIYNYDCIMMNPRSACNCEDYHNFKSDFIWRDNFLATWKGQNDGSILVWHHVDIIQCDYCSDSHMLYHTNKINDRYICNWCVLKELKLHPNFYHSIFV